MITAGMKVAHKVKTAPHCIAIVKVTPDGQNVIWQEIIDLHTGHHSNAFGRGFRFARTPKPLKGDEFPCPSEYANLVD
jgi:hypothetical protein